MNNWLNFTRRWRRPAVAATALAAGALGVVAVGTITGSAQAGEFGPEITANTISPTFDVTVPPFTFVPITVFTIPQPTLIEIPDVTFQTIPGDSTTTVETTTTTETTTSLDTTTSTDATTTTEPGSSPSGGAEPEYSVEINLAQINCDGTVHVEYTTTANPAPITLANHIVMFNPLGSAEFTVVETRENASNGSFAHDAPGSADQTYRLFVIALFDPANPDGPKVIDQADVALVSGC